MNKFKSIKVAFLSLAIFMLTIYAVEARQIGEFSDFKITYGGEKTGYLKKATSTNYVLNLYPSEDLAPMNVKHILLNISGKHRSGFGLLRAGKRGIYEHWATKGYYYALQMGRENWWDGAAYITGSWSPDER